MRTYIKTLVMRAYCRGLVPAALVTKAFSIFRLGDQ